MRKGILDEAMNMTKESGSGVMSVAKNFEIFNNQKLYRGRLT